MARKYHQNNFSTNVTSNQIAGVTTTPLNSIPSATAPFYIALDATNINGKYEVVEVTSKTATNILHAATTYAHTTAEEVRMVIPAEEMDAISEALSGGLGSGTDVHLDVRGRGNGLVKISVLRQNDTTNVYSPTSVILTGWGFVLGNSTNSLPTDAVTFGVTFSQKPIVITNYCGWKNSSDPTDNEGGGGEYGYFTSVSITTGGFSTYGYINTGLSSSYRIIYNWIAIGTL